MGAVRGRPDEIDEEEPGQQSRAQHCRLADAFCAQAIEYQAYGRFGNGNGNAEQNPASTNEFRGQAHAVEVKGLQVRFVCDTGGGDGPESQPIDHAPRHSPWFRGRGLAATSNRRHPDCAQAYLGPKVHQR